LNGWLAPPFRTNHSLDLLLRANLAAEGTALQAWQNWLRIKSIEKATWPEVRLLAPLARRLARLDPSSPLRSRLEGLAKSNWTRTQLTIRDCISALDALESAGIKFILFKGAACYAEGLASATRRIMADVDILVLPEEVIAASDRLCEAGWSSKQGHSPEILRQKVQIKLGGEDYRKGEYGEVDLHFRAYYFTRRSPELEANLWKKARLACFVGRPVLVPSPAESIVIGITDGLRSGEGDWAIDVGCRVSANPIDWDEVVRITIQRGLVPFVLSGLMYLKRLDCNIPQSALDRLGATRPTAGEYIKYWDFRLRRNNVPHRLRMLVQRFAHKLLPREQYEYE
jgi:hypothetical protein